MSDDQIEQDIRRLIELKREWNILGGKRTGLWRKAMELNKDIRVLTDKLGFATKEG